MLYYASLVERFLGFKHSSLGWLKNGVESKVPKKSRSQSKRTPLFLAAICELVKQGLSVRRAAEHLKVHHSTVAAWRSQDPQFDADVAAAEAQFIQGQLEIIKDAAKKGSWQASAWILERRLPAEFSQPQVQLSMPVNVEYKELSVVIEELRQSPEAMRLFPGLFDSLISLRKSTVSAGSGEQRIY